MPDIDIRDAFLDGIEEVFEIMFSDRVILHQFDAENTVINVYDESPSKKYLQGIALIGRVQLQMNPPTNITDEPMKGVGTTATITIPTKQLITHEIPRITNADLERLKQAMFSYNDEQYLVIDATPKTLVADEWQMYEFKCYRENDRSLLGGD